MAKHLSPDELADLVLDMAVQEGDPAARDHVVGCAACRARVDELRTTLAQLRDAEVPEPPAAYWQVFRRQLARRLDAEHTAPRASRWWAWAWVPALGVLAALVLVLTPRLAWHPPTPAPLASATALVPAWTPLPEAGEDTGLQVLQALASTGGLSTAVECHGLDECLVDLPDEEVQRLAQAFQAELQGGEL